MRIIIDDDGERTECYAGPFSDVHVARERAERLARKLGVPMMEWAQITGRGTHARLLYYVIRAAETPP